MISDSLHELRMRNKRGGKRDVNRVAGNAGAA